MRVSLRLGRDARFAIVCAALFLAGALLRYLYGGLAAPWANAGSDLALPPGLAETVQSFYGRLDRGDYHGVYRISLQNQWAELGANTYLSTGLTTEDAFVRDLQFEFGPHGQDLTIISLGIFAARALPRESQVVADRPALLAARHLPAAQVEAIYEVEVGGALLDRCSRWEWRQTLLVARLADGGWKALLPGNPHGRVTATDQWFLGVNPFEGKRVFLEKRLP
jgi:hypothetical protein